MSEWLLQQLTLRLNVNEDALLSMLPPYFKEGMHLRITILPCDVLAFCLSFVDLCDIKSCMLTCKTFYAASQKQQFWHKHIRRALECCIEKKKMVEKNKQDAVYLFNTFMSPVDENLRDQVEWVFKKSSWIKFASSIELVEITRCTHQETNLKNVIDISKTPIERRRMIWFVGAFFNSHVGRRVSKNFNNHEFLEYEVPKYKQPGVCLFTSCRVKGTFQGQCSFDKEKETYLPHGDGEWTFEDGTVLKGKGVANMGDPVFQVTHEEWKSIKKIKFT